MPKLDPSKQKQVTTIRLTIRAAKQLQLLSSKLGLSKTATIEMAIRKLAEGEGIPLPEDQDGK